mmetsp:Transcript_35285/g.91177  ORF Transcript_35285/g.91177 Transcript_35285/m.91177 type:complete len:251 (-) Transcript_35285:864-1616(-)
MRMKTGTGFALSIVRPRSALSPFHAVSSQENSGALPGPCNSSKIFLETPGMMGDKRCAQIRTPSAMTNISLMAFCFSSSGASGLIFAQGSTSMMRWFAWSQMNSALSAAISKLNFLNARSTLSGASTALLYTTLAFNASLLKASLGANGSTRLFLSNVSKRCTKFPKVLAKEAFTFLAKASVEKSPSSPKNKQLEKKKRTASGPNFSTRGIGSTTFPKDFPIFKPSFVRKPWLITCLGRGNPTAINIAGQ